MTDFQMLIQSHLQSTRQSDPAKAYELQELIQLCQSKSISDQQIYEILMQEV